MSNEPSSGQSSAEGPAFVQPPTDDGFLTALLGEPRESGDPPIGFVAVGDETDADLRYLTGVAGTDRQSAFVRVADERVLCPPIGAVDQVSDQFDGRILSERSGDPVGLRAVAALNEGAERTPAASSVVLTPATIPHDAALYLERAGYELQSTAAVREARATKSAAEVDAIAAVQDAAVSSVRQGEAILATATATGEELRWEGEALTAERLRRAVDAELVRRGVQAGGRTAVTAGALAQHEATGYGGTGADTSIRTGEPVRIDVAPHGPHGYHGALSRTVVVDSDGGWERRAYVAVESALDAALDEIEPGATVSEVRREVDAEVAAFGFDPGVGSADPTESVHGVGLEPRERPQSGGETVESGSVVAVTPCASDADYGSVALGELVAVGEDGVERLGEATWSFSPRPAE
ncbi:MAG: M24 family metallopeptidase [Halobellus sp.]|uniref:M24 family metallopeptidase n=1 Tax=Halobellus sp. TaxID=1979212 RepID=UPI0035D430BA